MTDQNNKTTTYAYDDADRLISVTDPANSTTYYAYDTGQPDLDHRRQQSHDQLCLQCARLGHIDDFSVNTV